MEKINRETETKKNAKQTRNFCVGLVLLFCVGLALPGVARAASLYLSPSTGSYNVGKTFSVSVYVSSADEAMNAASGVISFPSDKLEVISLSKSGSIFSLWVQEPSFSNIFGTINFEGIVLNPGFTGARGKIISVNFRAKAAGSASLNFSSGSVLANDGKGTNILTDMRGGTYTLITQLPSTEKKEKILADTAPPLPFEIKVLRKDEFDPQPILLFETTDKLSSIDYYEIKIAEMDKILRKTPSTENDPFKTPLLKPGKYTVIIKAVDVAGNYTLAMTEIIILALEAPVITDYPKELTPGNLLSIKGTAIPESTIIVSIKKDKEEVRKGETRSDKVGKWTFIEVEPLEKGIYKIWAEAIDSRGAKSDFSEEIIIEVIPPIFLRIGFLVIDYLTTFITLLVLIGIIIFAFIWFWQKIIKRKKRLRKEITEAEQVLYYAFKTLKEEIEKQISKLDGEVGLNEREKNICDRLKEALKISEEFIGKEISDIEKELK